MDIINIKKQKEIFINYANKYVGENDKEKLSMYMDKINHSVRVLESALSVDKEFTKYNDSFIRLLALESLFHDIGRFEQLKKTNTFDDFYVSKYFSNTFDHGDLGSLLLIKHHLLYYLIPNRRVYDEDIKSTVKSHSKMNNSLDIDIKCIERFMHYELKDVFKPNMEYERKNLFNTNLAIIQDTDRLDIYRKIVEGINVPKSTDQAIEYELLKLYKMDCLPSMHELKKMNKWNPNIGHLVRLNFINQINLIPVLEKIKNENLIDKMYDIIGNSVLKDAYEIAKEKLDKQISNTENGVLVKRKIL